MPDISEDLRKIKEAIYGEDVRDSIHDAIKDINDVCEDNVDTVQQITDQAMAYRDTATQQATNAADSASTATQQATIAVNSASTATEQATAATSQAQEATQQATNAADSASTATQQATAAATQATNAANSATAASESETKAEQWYNKAKQVAETMSGPTRLLGTIPFADLPSVSDSVTGDMWNISDAFTTTVDFEEGAGHDYKAGCNVYLTNNNKWDVQVSDYGQVLVAMDEIINGALVLPEEM